MIRFHNETLLIEPSTETQNQHLLHIVYPPQSSVLRHISLADDQVFHQPATQVRRKRNIDYDDYGNEVTNTVNTPQESVSIEFISISNSINSETSSVSICSYRDYDDWREEEEEDNAIDDDEDALISDRCSHHLPSEGLAFTNQRSIARFVEIEDYDTHPPPEVTEVRLSSNENEESDNGTADEVDDPADVDGFTVDKLWDVPKGIHYKIIVTCTVTNQC